MVAAVCGIFSLAKRHDRHLVAEAVGPVRVDAVVDVALAAAQQLHQPCEVLPHHRVARHHDVDALQRIRSVSVTRLDALCRSASASGKTAGRMYPRSG